MATLEDKLLGEKLEYYCSSSEGEDNNEEDDDDKGKSKAELKLDDADLVAPTPSECYRNQSSTNTGPKGVVKDWQRFKQLQAEKREESEKLRLEMAKKLTMTTATAKEDEERKRQEEFDAELEELMSEEFLQQFQKQRMAEMMRQCGAAQKFGKVLVLSTHQEFLDAVEKENKHTTVIIHIYDKTVRACATLNNCMDTLASEYQHVKFAKICSSVAGMSRDFRDKGLPALLVYKAGALIGNFVRITDDLSDEFYASDVESFLIEHGIIIDKALYN